MTPTYHRRQVLRGMLAGAVTLPLQGLLAHAARAQTGDEPTRGLFVFFPDGCSQPHWHPTGSAGSFTLPAMTQPLDSVRQDLVFLRGINMYSGGATHEGGVRKLLTATGGVSLDVLVGQFYRNATPFSFYSLGVGANHENGGNYMSFIGQDQPITPEDNPQKAFDDLFGGAAAGSGGTPSPEQRRVGSVLDSSLSDLAALRSRLGQTERQKLELHSESIREIERRLTPGAGAPAGQRCQNPTWNAQGWQPPDDARGQYPLYWNRNDQFDTVLRLQIDLAVLALQCDLTRSIALQISHPVSPTDLGAELGTTQRHHDASHFDANNEASIQNFIAWKRYYCEQLAYLVNRLREVPMSNGTLLDNTVVMVGSDLGHGSRHDHADMPFLLAGRAGGLQTGRLLDYRGSNRTQNASGENESHAKLLVSLGNALGIPLEEFGYTGHGRGPLPGLYV